MIGKDRNTTKCKCLDRWRSTRCLCSILVLISVVETACNDNLVDPAADSCAPADGASVSYGFYAFFAPVSYSEDPDTDSPGFQKHIGYEAYLLDALEAMDEAGLSFRRQPIENWPGIWLRPATAEFDMVGGGITILESRTLDASGERAIAFTSGHIAFHQSLLVRSEDAMRYTSYDRLTSEVRVGVLRSTTGEDRLLQITGITNADGVLSPGTRVVTPQDTVVADGTAQYTITASRVSNELEGRTHLIPPSTAMPQVVYLGDVLGEDELISALLDGTIEAVARGEVGNGEAARASDGVLAVSAVDTSAEYGGFAFDANNTDLLACIDERLQWLTNERRIGYAEWRADSLVFRARAAQWNP